MNEVERLRSQHERLHKLVGCDRLELYHRSSAAMRIRLEESEEPTLSRQGTEEGIAVRLPGRFAAASGADDNSVRWAIERARACAATAGAGNWGPGGGEFEDLDGSAGMPSLPEMRSWLDRAVKLLPERPVRAWVEAATTAESLVADGGLQTSRYRCRAWAMAWIRQRPLIVASRGWELPEAGWTDQIADREPRGGRLPVVFTAESAAKLVLALVRSFHNDEKRVGEPCGPGWRLFDDPRAAGALFGGSFDDAAFRTERRLLADGERICGAISGPGTLRRPSFRDPPQSLPSHLIVEPAAVEPPDDRLLVSELTIHPLSPGEWALQIGEGLIRTTPTQLIRGCTAAIGPPRLSHHGVLTPGLLFEGLEVRL